jgi:RHS repeat-associated protein
MQKRILKQAVIIVALVTSFQNLCAQGNTIITSTTPTMNIQGGSTQNIIPTSTDYKSRDKIIVKPGASSVIISPINNFSSKNKLYTDDNLVTSTEYNTAANTGFSENNISLDYNLTPGTIGGSADINGIGGAIYSISIDLPKGSSVLNPQGISLNYASGSDRGIAGLGWNISGLQSINRIPMNLNDNGKVVGVNRNGFSNDDAFALNGNLLQSIGTIQYGFNGATYKCRNADFSEIKSYSPNTTSSIPAYFGPEWFEVKTKDGLLLEFGKNSNAIMSEYPGTVNVNSKFSLIWMITKITDIHGNYIVYEYDNQNGNSYPIIKKISYTGNSVLNINPDCEVNFYYELNKFKNKVTGINDEYDDNLHLRKIVVKSNGKLYKSYNLEYIQKNTFDFLVSIQASNCDGEKMNKTNFIYNTPLTDGALSSFQTINNFTIANGQTYQPIANNNNRKIIFGDFNDDGYKDFATIPVSVPSGGTGTVEFYKRGNNNSFELYDFITYTFPASSYYNKAIINSTNPTSIQGLNTDFNGDGIDDLALYSLYTTPYAGGKIMAHIKIIFKPKGQNVNILDHMDVELGSLTGVNIQSNIIAGDFNGDRRTDLACLYSSNSISVIKVLSNLKPGIQVNHNLNVKTFSSSNFNFGNSYTEDMNGDGLDDIGPLGFSGDLINIVPQQITVHESPLCYTTVNPGDPHVNPPEPDEIIDERIVVVKGDFNGDGKLDILKSATGTTTFNWIIYYYKDIFDYNNPAPLNLPLISPNCEDKYLAANLNGDSKADLIFLHYNWNSVVVNKYISTGLNFEFAGSFTVNGNFLNTDPLIAELYGDGVDDLIFYEYPISGIPIIKVLNFTSSISQFHLNTVIDGLGNKVVYEYSNPSFILNQGETEPATNLFSTSSVNLGSANDYTDVFNNPLIGVRKIKTLNAKGTFNEVEFKYHNPIINLNGKGFIGYEKTTKIDHTFGSMQVINNSLAYLDYALVLPSEIKNYSIINSITNPTLVNTVSKEYSIRDILNYSVPPFTQGVNRILLVDNARNTYTDHINNIAKVEEVISDDDGNVLNSVININNGFEVTEVTNSYHPTRKNTVPYLLEHKVITKTRSNESNERAIDYTYTLQHLIESKVEDQNLSSFTKTSNYIYYANGSLKEMSVAAPNAILRTTKYEYDPQFKNIKKTINPLNQNTLAEFHPVFNSITKLTDISNNSESRIYDAWGRLIITRDISQQVTSKEYKWVTSGEINFNLHPITFNSPILKVITKAANSPINIDYLDLLGQKVLSESKDFEGNTIYEATEVNNKGQVVKSTQSYRLPLSNGIPLITEYTYDNLDRVKTTTLSANGVNLPPTINNYSIYTQPSWVEIISSDGKKKKTFTDATNNVVKIIDDQNSELNFEYAFITATNKSTVITKNGQKVLNTVLRGPVGNQEQLIDTQSGTTSYSYNAFDQLLNETNPKGDVTSYTYNVLGDILTSVINESGNLSNYNYTYETTNLNGLNQIKTVTGPNSNFYYTYDNFNQLSTINESINGQNYLTAYEYNIYGSIIKRTFPSGFSIRNTFDENGYLKRIARDDNNQTIWEGYSVDNFNNIKSFKTANNNLNEYNHFGILSAQHANNSGNSDILNLQYDFNSQNGNLNFRNYVNKNYRENFTFDNLNQLKQVSDNNTGLITQSIAYNSFGQIISKSDASSNYEYNLNTLKLNKLNCTEPAVNLSQRNISFTAFQKPKSISEGIFKLDMDYGPDMNKVKSTWTNLNTNSVYRTRIYATDYEVTNELSSNNTYKVHYILAPTGMAAMFVIENSNPGTLYFTHTDHLGSMVAITNSSGNLLHEQNFDAWGRRRNPNTLAYLANGTNGNLPKWLYRGYTGQEMLDEFTLINLNARLYDPVIGLMIGPDNLIGDATSIIGFNRYAYAKNNPLKFIDPDGNDPLLVGAIVGGVIGGISGYQVGKAQGATGWNLFFYTIGGAAIGAASGIIGAQVALSGGIASNTLGIISSSLVNSAGMHLLSDGKIPLSVSFGGASYNLNSNQWGYLGNPKNTWQENLGYGFGALANLQDAVAGFNGTNLDVSARKDLSGHSSDNGSYVDKTGKSNDILISVGPADDFIDIKPTADGLKWESQFLHRSVKGQNYDYIKNHPDIRNGKVIEPFKHTLRNVNGKILVKMTENLNAGKTLTGIGNLKYSVLRGCVNYTSRALFLAGVPTVNAFLPITSPVFLNFELAVRQAGIFASPHLTNNKLK